MRTFLAATVTILNVKKCVESCSIPHLNDYFPHSDGQFPARTTRDERENMMYTAR